MSRDYLNGRKRSYEDDPKTDHYAPKRRRTDSREDLNGAPFPIGFKYLEDICKDGVPENAILGLVRKSERFEALLTSEEIRPDLLKMVIRAFRLLCSKNNLVAKNAENVLRSSATVKFWTGTVLSSFIDDMPHSNCWKDENDRIHVLNDLMEIFRVLIPTFGDSFVNKLPLAQLIVSLNELKEKNLINDTEDLERKIQHLKALKNEVIRRARSAHDQEPEAEPPQSFRELSVIPQALDLFSKPFLRKNVIERKFNDLEHYLDVQFRLLREDFVKPLRDGIRQLTNENNSLELSVEDKKTKRTNKVSVYRRVSVQYPVCNRKGLLYRIRFDSKHSKVKQVNWERSKRLKFGSLVCLSSDDFKSLVFATVEDRNPKDLSVGELDVRFQNVDKEEIAVFVKEKEEFVMIESPAYFEAYRHVLEAMKNIKPEEFPFQKYIVECVHNVEPPKYQRERQGEPISFDFTALCGRSPAKKSKTSEAYAARAQKDESQVAGTTVNDSSSSLEVARTHEMSFDWPDRKILGFNESQMRAFKLALTKEFAVIQGPPGTGKTYVGLKIAQAFLKNASIWQNGEGNSPIVMVSYTNHALDQFLEGLLPMEGIVRVGSRSRSEKLNEYSLVQCLQREKHTTDVATRQVRRTAKREIEDHRRLYKRSSLLLKASRTAILSLQELYDQECVAKRHFHQFWVKARNRPINEELVTWLDIEREGTTGRSRSEDYHGRNDFRMEFATPGFIFDDDETSAENGKLGGIVVLSMQDAKNPNYVRRNLTTDEAMTDSQERRIRDVYRLGRRDRWRLYKLWLQRLEINQKEHLKTFQETYEEALSREAELNTNREYKVLRKARVIGMTTTCAARYRRILQRICPKIILIEEAAEVLEAHTTTSLTQGCQHLILIGDHQQLRPKPEVYDLAKNYNLDVSLFERMVKVGIHCETLNIQHRMRPEIAALMTHIYNDLQSHESVEKYEDIKGMKKNMFFINHSHLEDPCEDSHSHVNKHEAIFLVALCRYLLQQGYAAHQITLLTTYTGQMFTIRDCLREGNSGEVDKVCLKTVDNFQGQENDIILLSLVRSNKDGNAGFLKIVNRACVALSRAKKGFYCIGNFALLSGAGEVWSKIVKDLERSGNIGNELPLSCQTHREENTAKRAEDFSEKAPFGGCLRPCMVRLKCGHVCKQQCHPRDTKHENYTCDEPCGRTLLGCGHPCLNPCKEPCTEYCEELVDKALPGCGHVVKNIACGTNVDELECKERCEKILPCGHRCQDYCSQACTPKCNEFKKISRTDWPCGHEVTIACWATSSDCTAPCGGFLECGHPCTGNCGECRLGRLHKGCMEECQRNLLCSHVCKERCSIPCPPCPRSCENRCEHSECDKACEELCTPCRYPCSWECRHYKCYKRCHEVCDRPRCDVICGKILPCDHVCRGLMCEECICAVCMKNDDTFKVTDVFFGGEDEEDARFIRLPDCRHIFAVSDLDRYMNMSPDEATEDHMIQTKVCPRCSIPIRSCLRYSAVIKQQMHDIQKVKIEKWKISKTASHELQEKKSDLEKRLESLETRFTGGRQKKSLGILKNSVAGLLKHDDQLMVSIKENEVKTALAENKVTLMERLYSMHVKTKANLNKISMEILKENKLQSKHAKNELSYLEKRFMSTRVTQRELQDINTEFSRLNLQLEFCLLSHDVKSLDLKLDESCQEMLIEVKEQLSSGKRIGDEELEKLMKNVETIRTHPVLKPLTPEDKKEIVKAIGLSKGHWFKCPLGHVYAIGECGGAMETSKCPECKAVIGGTRHTLVEGNQLAPEMDNANYPAWSEQANLANYGNLDEIV